MSTAAAIMPAYFALNAAITAGALALLLVEKLAPRISPRSLLQLHYRVIGALFLCVAVQALLPQGLLPGDTLFSIDLRAIAIGDGAALTGSLAEPVRSFDAGSFARLWIATALALLASGVALVLRDVYRLRSLLLGSHLVRRVGRVRIWVHDHAPTPFSFWRPGRAHVVLPAYLLRDSQSLRIAPPMNCNTIGSATPSGYTCSPRSVWSVPPIPSYMYGRTRRGAPRNLRVTRH